MGEFWDTHKHVIILVALLVVAFVILHFPFSKGNLDKDTLPVSITYDNYYHPVVSKGVFDREQQQTYAPYRAMGVTNAVIADPPLHFTIPATFTKLTTLPFYQGHFFISVLILLWTSVIAFVLFRRVFSPTIAIIAAAFALVPPGVAWLFQLYIGFTNSIEAFFFALFILFLLVYTLEHPSILAAALMGAGFAAQFLTHGPIEAGYTFLFVTITMGVLWKKRHAAWLLGHWLVIFGTAAVLSFYQYVLLRMARITGEGIRETLFGGKPIPEYFPQPGLGWLITILVLIGAVVLVLRVVSKKMSKQQLVVASFLAFMLAVAFSYVLGVDGSRSFRQLYSAYPLLALLPAIGVVALWNQVKRRVSDRFVPLFEIAVVALIVGFSISPIFAGLASIGANGQATPERWQTLSWVREHTPPDARVFYLFGFEHEFGMLAERTPFKGDLGLGYTQRNILELCNGRFPQNFSGQWGSAITVRADEGRMLVPTKEGLFRTSWHVITRPGTDIIIPKPEDQVALSGFDYVVVQHAGTQADSCMAFFLKEALAQNATVAWKNNQFTILEVA